MTQRSTDEKQTVTPPLPPNVRSDAHERLAFLEGSWEVEESPPEQDFVETCAWLPGGRRHMVCSSSWQAPAGAHEALSVLSHDAGAGCYLYHGFRAGGSVVVQRGHFEGDSLVFMDDVPATAGAVRTRVRLTPQRDGSVSFVEESCEGTGPWSAGERLTYRRRA